MSRPWKILPLLALHGALALWAACAAAPLKTAGTLLVELDAADFKPGAEKWPQHAAGTGIAGDFAAKGTPTRQKVAGADAVVFDGDGDYFIGPITTAALHAPGAKHSVETWVYQGNVRDQESVVSWGKRWGPDLTFAGFRYGADPDFGAVARWGASESGFASVPPPGRWHHLAYTYDGKYQSVYVDGKLDNSRAVGVMDAHDMLPIHLGAEICGDLRLEGQFTHYSGALAKVRIHSGALTADEVKANYGAEKSRFPGISATPLRQSPMHRFSFTAPAGPAPDGSTVADSIGGLAAVIRGAGAQFTGTAVELPGGNSATQAYIDLPNGLISARENVTIEFWETQLAPGNWCRILSIGTNRGGEITGPGGNFNGSESLTLFGNVGAAPVNRFARSFGICPNGGPDRNPAEYPDTDLGVEFHQVITYHKSLQEWHWYRNGVLMEVIPDLLGPTTLPDVNVWLGRSEFSMDSNFRGRFHEFRIYNHPLDEGEIYGNFLAGPDKIDLNGRYPAMNWKPVAAGDHTYANAPGEDQWGTGAGGPPPDGPGVTATFASALEDDQQVRLDAPVTLGTLNLGSRSRVGSFTLGGGKSGGLAMDSGSSANASITQFPGSPGNVIDLPLTLRSDTEITNQAATPLTLSGPLGGGGALVKGGAGPVVLSGTDGDHQGAVKIVSGALILRDSRSSGTQPPCQVSVAYPGELVLDRAGGTELCGTFSGTGRVVHRGGGKLALPAETSIAITGDLILADGAGAFSTAGTIAGPRSVVTDSDLVFEPGGKTRLTGALSIGSGNGGSATVRDRASVETGHLNVGDTGSGQSVLTLAGGSVSCRELFVGKNTGVAGVLLQSGGDLTKGRQDVLLDSRVGGAFPNASDAWGAWRMTGGTYSDDWNLQIGGYGTGILEVDGGKVAVAGFLGIGRYEGEANRPSHGLLDVKSGSVTTTSPDNLLLVGEEGIGVLNVRGSGVVTCANRTIVGAGSLKNPGEGTVNLLSGGTLETGGIGQLNQTEATGRINFDGGTLRALKASDNFIEGIDSALVREGGARIDTNGHDVKIALPFAAPRGNGVVTIPVLAGGAGYLGPPFIDISGGAGSGATAIAEIAGGAVTGVTVTHAGSDYLTPPAVTVLGGGSGTGIVLGTPVLAANAGGGLVKTGEGTLTLGGENTYPGPTAVEWGGLRIEGRVAGGVRVAAGATLGGAGKIGGSLDVAPGSKISPDPGEALEIAGDAALHGTLSTLATAAGCGRLEIAGALDLAGATLAVRAADAGAVGTSHVIASYGSLRGKFAGPLALPPGCTLDYRFNGRNQIAIVAAVAKTDGD